MDGWKKERKKERKRRTFHFNFCMLSQDIAVNRTHTVNLAVIVLCVKSNVVGSLQTEKGYEFAASRDSQEFHQARPLRSS